MKTRKLVSISLAAVSLFAATYAIEVLVTPTTVMAAEKRTAYNVTTLKYANNPAAEKFQILVSDKGAEEMGHDFSIDVNLSTPATSVSAFAFSIFDANGKEITVESDGGVYVGEKNFHYPAGASISQSRTGVLHVKDLPAGTYTVKMSGHSISENDDRIFYSEKSFTLPGFGVPAPKTTTTTTTTTVAPTTTQAPTTTTVTTTQAPVTTQAPKTTQAPATSTTATTASTTATQAPTTAQEPTTSMDTTAPTSKATTVQAPVTTEQPKATKKVVKAVLPKTGTTNSPVWIIAGLSILASAALAFFTRKES